MRDTPEKYKSSTSICSDVSTTSIPNSEDYVFNTMHPNYQNMMNDSHLIDRCSEAQIDIEAVQSTSLTSTRTEFTHKVQPYMKFKPEVATSSTIGSQQMLEWIRFMDTYVGSVAPTINETMRMNLFERKTRYQEVHDLRKYIASYDMTVKKLIRSSNSQILDGVDLQSLQEQYLCLLLRAYETQCLLEGFPELEDNYLQSTRQYPENAKGSITNIYKLCEIDLGSSSRDGSSVEIMTNKHSDYHSGDEQCDTGIYTPSCRAYTPAANLGDEILHIIKQPTDLNESNSRAPKFMQTIRIVNRKKNLKVNQWLKRNPANIHRNYLSSESSESPGYSSFDFMTNDIVYNETASINDSTSGIGNSISNASNEQLWDDYQETYSLSSLGASSESCFDLAATERLLNFGDDYSELLRSTSSDSLNSIKSINLLNDNNFLFFNTKTSIQSIDDLFAMTRTSKDSEFLFDNILMDKRHRRQLGVQSTYDLNKILRLDSTNSLPADYTTNINDTQIESLYLRGSRTSCYSDSIRKNDSATFNVTTVAKRKCASTIIKNTKLNRKYHTRVNGSNRFRRCVSNNDISRVKDLLLVNVQQMQAEDIEAIMTICKNNVSCLNSVLVGRSGDLQSCRSLQPTIDIGTTTLDSDWNNDGCQCGIIACYVQSIVDFLSDYTNVFRSCRLYNKFIMLLKLLYKIIKFLSVRTGQYRRKHNSIEVLL